MNHPYHLQTDGLVKTTTTLNMQYWQNGKSGISYYHTCYLFTEASTVYPPFELLYGRYVSGPLRHFERKFGSKREN